MIRVSRWYKECSFAPINAGAPLDVFTGPGQRVAFSLQYQDKRITTAAMGFHVCPWRDFGYVHVDHAIVGRWPAHGPADAAIGSIPKGYRTCIADEVRRGSSLA